MTNKNEKRIFVPSDFLHANCVLTKECKVFRQLCTCKIVTIIELMALFFMMRSKKNRKTKILYISLQSIIMI